MQAIMTRYRGPSATHGSRIYATCDGGKAYTEYRHELSSEGNHRAACRHLAKKMKWPTTGWQEGYYNNRTIFVRAGDLHRFVDSLGYLESDCTDETLGRVLEEARELTAE